MTPQADKSVKSLRTASSCIRTKRFSISIFRSATNLCTRKLWLINMFTTALHRPKQAEKWLQVRETFN